MNLLSQSALDRAARLAFVLLALVIPDQGLPQDVVSNEIETRVHSHLAAARKAEAVKDYLAASEEYSKIIELRPGWALIHQSLGVTYHLSKRYEQAITQFREAVRLDDQLWGAFLFLGMDYYQIYEFGSAIAALEKSLALNPKMAGPEARRWLGLSHGALQQYDVAIDYLMSVVDRTDDDIEAWFHLSRLCDLRASELFETIGRLEPHSPFVHLLQAERFMSESNDERARLEYAHALELRPDLESVVTFSEGPARPSPHPAEPGSDSFAAVRADFLAGRYRAAAANARHRFSLAPNSTEAMYWLGRSYKGLAVTALGRLIDAAPESYRVDQILAQQHEEKTEYANALKAYQKALAKRPDLPGLRYAIGNIYWKTRRYEEAEKWLSEELKSNSYHALAHYRLGGLYLDQGKTTEAILHLKRTVAANPELPAARLDLGRAFLADEQYGAAVNELQAYSRADPNSDRVHYLLANAYRALGRMEDAEAELRLYQQLSRQRLHKVQEDVRSVSDELKMAPK